MAVRNMLESLGEVRSRRTSTQILLSGTLIVIGFLLYLLVLAVGVNAWLTYWWLYPASLLVTYIAAVLIKSYGRIYLAWDEVGRLFFRWQTLARISLILGLATGLIALNVYLIRRIAG